MRTPVNIETLIRLACKGDPDAFGRLYDRYIDTIYRFVYVRVGIREDAEDVTEQVFLNVFKAIRSYRDRGIPFEAWLFKVARNKIIDYYRTKKTHVTLDAIPNLPDNATLPDQATEVHITYDLVLATIAKLPDTYQEILILKFVEEKNNDEISAILGKPREHVRVLQSRALRKLRQCLNI